MKPAGEMLPVRGVRACLVIGAVGAVAIGVGWYQAAGRIRVAGQMNWTMVSVAGTVAIGLATLLWVLAARRAVEQRLGAVLSGAEQTRMPTTPIVALLPGADNWVVATENMGRFHRPSCPLTRGKTVRRASRADQEQAGRRPCGVCRP